MARQQPQRIVSLLPGATEWVCRFGLGHRLVGISHQCDFPPEIDSLPRVTRSRIDSELPSGEINDAVAAHSETRTPLYDLLTETLLALKPDLILTQSLCNVCAVSERDVLRTVSQLGDGCTLIDLSAQTLDQVMADATAIADATGRCRQSLEVIASLQDRTKRVRDAAAGIDPRPSVTLLEWVDPLFCAGHWTPQLIEWSGGNDPIGRVGQPSRNISPQELLRADPDILLVACCGWNADRTRAELPILERIQGWSELRCVKAGQVHPLDGSAYFNRPGPRLADALERVAAIVERWAAPQTRNVELPDCQER